MPPHIIPFSLSKRKEERKKKIFSCVLPRTSSRFFLSSIRMEMCWVQLHQRKIYTGEANRAEKQDIFSWLDSKISFFSAHINSCWPKADLEIFPIRLLVQLSRRTLHWRRFFIILRISPILRFLCEETHIANSRCSKIRKRSLFFSTLKKLLHLHSAHVKNQTGQRKRDMMQNERGPSCITVIVWPY